MQTGTGFPGPFVVYPPMFSHPLFPLSECSLGDTPFLLPSWGPAPAGPSGRAGHPGSREATCQERTGLRFLFPVWPGKGPEGGAGSEMDRFGPQASGCGGLGLGLAGGEWKNRTFWGGQSRTRPQERSPLKQARQTSVFPACKASKAKGRW